jgi:hypothetical protein
MTKSVKTRRMQSVKKNLYSFYNSYVMLGISHNDLHLESLYNVGCGHASPEGQASFLRFAAQKLIEYANELENK